VPCGDATPVFVVRSGRGSGCWLGGQGSSRPRPGDRTTAGGDLREWLQPLTLRNGAGAARLRCAARRERTRLRAATGEGGDGRHDGPGGRTLACLDCHQRRSGSICSKPNTRTFGPDDAEIGEAHPTAEVMIIVNSRTRRSRLSLGTATRDRHGDGRDQPSPSRPISRIWFIHILIAA
jgi:hypothetical protein